MNLNIDSRDPRDGQGSEILLDWRDNMESLSAGLKKELSRVGDSSQGVDDFESPADGQGAQLPRVQRVAPESPELEFDKIETATENIGTQVVELLKN